MFQYPQTQPTPATLKLRAAGEIIGRFMDFDDARKFGRKARHLTRDAHSQTRQAPGYYIGGAILDDLLPLGVPYDDIDEVAEGFAAMRPTCSPKADLLAFDVGTLIAQSHQVLAA